MESRSQKNPPNKIWPIVLITLCVIYLINPTAGLFELLPDNIPFFGNIDEGLASFLIFSAIQYMRTGQFLLPKS